MPIMQRGGLTMTPYILTAYNSRNILAEGTLLDCWKVLRYFAEGMNVVEAMAWYSIDKAKQEG